MDDNQRDRVLLELLTREMGDESCAYLAVELDLVHEIRDHYTRTNCVLKGLDKHLRKLGVEP